MGKLLLFVAFAAAIGLPLSLAACDDSDPPAEGEGEGEGDGGDGLGFCDLHCDDDDGTAGRSIGEWYACTAAEAEAEGFPCDPRVSCADCQNQLDEFAAGGTCGPGGAFPIDCPQ